MAGRWSGLVDQTSSDRPPLDAAFFARPTLQVARELLGCIVRHDSATGSLAAIIVEVEAYIGRDDPACHAARGRTRRNESMWGAPGMAYVYKSYGLHWMLNLVTERPDYPAAVLLRAAEPWPNHALLAARCPGQAVADWLSGPGRLTQGLAITGSLDGAMVTGGVLTVRQGLVIPDQQVLVSHRIGISQGLDRPWRLFIAGHRQVSARSVRGQPYQPSPSQANLIGRADPP